MRTNDGLLERFYVGGPVSLRRAVTDPRTSTEGEGESRETQKSGGRQGTWDTDQGKRTEVRTVTETV